MIFKDDEFQTITRCFEAINERLRMAPDFNVFNYLKNQIDYLINIQIGKEADLSKLSNINLGLIAIREFEQSDPDLAENLFATQACVDRYLRKQKSSI